MSIKQIQKRIEEIKKELSGLGPIHPGSISRQYNVCGTPGCKCKDPKNPQKHGPYYQLSFIVRGRHSTRFVSEEQLTLTEEKVKNHKRLRELVDEWIALSAEEECLERAAAK